jgi:hypothetical protein
MKNPASHVVVSQDITAESTYYMSQLSPFSTLRSSQLRIGFLIPETFMRESDSKQDSSQGFRQVLFTHFAFF